MASKDVREQQADSAHKGPLKVHLDLQVRMLRVPKDSRYKERQLQSMSPMQSRGWAWSDGWTFLLCSREQESRRGSALCSCPSSAL